MLTEQIETLIIRDPKQTDGTPSESAQHVKEFVITLNAEISGFYTTKARNDLQEILSPTGQLSAGLVKTILKGKGSLKLSARDIFYTQSMEGLTDFPGASEYFILWRDSQVINLGFSYRFGKPLKATKRSTGGAGDEMNRAGA